MVSFNEVPSNLRIPFVAVEIDNSKSAQGPALLAYQALVLGQITASGTGTADTFHLVTNEDQVGVLAGRDSMLFQQAKAWFANNKQTPMYVGLLADNGAGTAAAGTVQFTSAATADGTLHFRYGGVPVSVAVTSGDAVGDMAAALEAALALIESENPHTSAVLTDTVTTTFNHKGEAGNDYDIRINYQDGEELPAGVALTIVQPTGGASNPVLTGIISAIGDEWFQIWAHPYTDATSLTAIEAELSSRFSATRMIDGMSFTSSVGSVSTLNALGNTRNSQHSSIVAQSGADTITPSYEYSAGVAGVASIEGARDPARPFQTVGLVGMLPPVVKFTDTERNTLLFNGIATTKTDDGGVARLDRLITTYKTNAAGGADTSYLDVNTMLTLLYLRFSFRARIVNKYPRHKLANDGTKFGPGQAVMTPILGKAEAVSWFVDMERLGLVEGRADFKTNLVVDRNDLDPNRLDFLLPPDLINQLIVTAAQIQFQLCKGFKTCNEERELFS